MDTRPVKYLHHRLAHFREVVDETRLHFPCLSAFGKYPPSAPYYEKYGILRLLTSLDADPAVCDELLQEYQEICRSLEDFENEQKEAYRQKLLDEIHACMDRYSAAVCHANLGLLNFETDHEVFHRDLITILIHELERDHDMTEVKTLLGVLDANLFPAKECPGAENLFEPYRASSPVHSRNNGDSIES